MCYSLGIVVAVGVIGFLVGVLLIACTAASVDDRCVSAGTCDRRIA